MPVTPLHLGPGLVFKALGGRRLSITVFTFSQVLMDLEVIASVALRSDRLHGFTNTIAGASIVLIPSILIGRPAGIAFLRWWDRNAPPGLAGGGGPMPWSAAFWGGALGVYSHWFLDAMMHADALPLWPFTQANPLITWLSIAQINLWSLVLVGAGGIAVAVAGWARKRTG